MARSHINPETGEAGRCTAQWNCPYAKLGKELNMETHFPTIKEARAVGEKIKEKMFGEFSVTVNGKQKSIDDLIKLAKKDKLTTDELHELAKSDNPIITNLLSAREDLDLPTIDLLIKNGTDTTWETLFGNDKLPKEGYLKLANFALVKKDRKLDKLLVDNYDLPKDALTTLSKNSKLWMYDIYRSYIDNPNLTTEALDNFSDQYKNIGDMPLTADISKNPRTSENLIKRIASNAGGLYGFEMHEILDNLAQNRRCPADIKRDVAILNRDYQIAEDKNSTAAQLEEVWNRNFDNSANLVKAQKKEILTTVIRNENLDNDRKIAIVNEGDWEQKSELLRSHRIDNQELHDAVAKMFNSGDDNEKFVARRALSRSTVATPEELINLANLGVEKDDETLLENVAGNPNIPSALLSRMSKSRYIAVKCAIAKNPNTPEDILLRYSTMKNTGLLKELGSNKKLPVEAQKNIAKENREDFWTLKELLNNPSIDPATLDILADSTNGRVVEKVREHPRTSMKTLLHISSRDPEEYKDKWGW